MQNPAVCLRLPVSTHSRPKAAGSIRGKRRLTLVCFNTQPPEGGWVYYRAVFNSLFVSTHSRPKAAGKNKAQIYRLIKVSTHSRPKAAGRTIAVKCVCQRRFNTQPPEGGWLVYATTKNLYTCFNTQPPEGGWPSILQWAGEACPFQHTAARRRLEVGRFAVKHEFFVSTHSRPKAAGWIRGQR